MILLKYRCDFLLKNIYSSILKAFNLIFKSYFNFSKLKLITTKRFDVPTN